MNLYTTHAKEFSDSRQSSWIGWQKLNQFLIPNSSVLDLGCGNGRFLKFLVTSPKSQVANYVGIDNSKILLNIARKSIQPLNHSTTYQFFDYDLEKEDWINKVEPQKFNLIVGFGFMHHMHTFKQRRMIYENAEKLLGKDGVFVLTFWQFAKLKRYENKLKKLEGNEDYELSFGTNGAVRFCHYCDETEIKELEKNLHLKRIAEYYSDGKEFNENFYVVYKKDE